MRSLVQITPALPDSRSHQKARYANRTWFFDLDNTLHNASAHIFPHIGRSMRDYICRYLDLDENEATQLRQQYWKRYGATLLGLIRHYDIDPEHFLHHTHQFHDLASMVVIERGLKSMLKQLPGRKIIFSNAPLDYTQAILAITGIRHCFDAVYSVERLRFNPKPQTKGFLHLLRTEGLDPRACVMIEDTLPNLKTAKRLGMKTVWVNPGLRKPPYADIRVRSVLDLPGRLGQL